MLTCSHHAQARALRRIRGNGPVRYARYALKVRVLKVRQRLHDRGTVLHKRLLRAALQVVDQFELLADAAFAGWSGCEKVRQAAVDGATGLQPDEEQPGALQV
ncbi:hypothetical protein [Protofrankia symbiont of Coriaria ruscifolia]|uniref:hypothetical protein n=1 Tax=Protofrankia symbiont of Coriaria ruscifolia TaxID=1306542 RepID=UPI001A94CCD0|nr:hypothetical protein [Protofrankia symbiont of Coriaria ruscifolia]